MNQVYQLVWNCTRQAWVVAGELAKSAKKSSGKTKTLTLALLLATGCSMGVATAAPVANALPTGESVATGAATFDRSVTNQLTVNQSSSGLITNWSSFDVGSNGKVIFTQPDAASIALNRVTSGSVTEIFGQVSANGKLVIVNPNGITFGTGSQVNAASVIASVLDIQDSDFNSGTFIFSRGSATGSIDNQGSLTAVAGSVALLAPTLKNTGSITATGGNASLINTDAVNLIKLNPSIPTASSITGFIRQSGSITATQVSSVGGKILLTGDTSQAASQIQLAGTLDASTNSNINGRSILVNGDVNLNGASNVLDLTSTDGYSLTNAAAINLNGASSGFSVNGAAYTVIRNVSQLQSIDDNLAGSYVLANDIDASVTATWNSYTGFVSLGGNGDNTRYFTGIMDGLGHAISALSINRPLFNNIGLFGYVSNASIQNIGLSNANIKGNTFVGMLVGRADTGSIINNSYASGSVSGAYQFAGGLVGLNRGSISNSYASGSVAGDSYAGALVGLNAGSISNSYASGSVTGSYVGGLAGGNSGSIGNSYASGYVAGGGNAGGLVGGNNGNVYDSYWNTQTTGVTLAIRVSTGGTATNLKGLTTVQSRQLASYGNWGSSIDAQGGSGSVWRIYEGQTGPLLRSFLKPLTVSMNNASKTYDGVAYTSNNGYILSIPGASLLGSLTAAGTASGARHVGTYVLDGSGLYSNQQGYDISFSAGTLTISKAALILTTGDVSKTYDGTTAALGTAVATGGTQLFAGDSLSGGSFVFDNKHAGTGKTVTVSGVMVNDGNSGNNYDVSYMDNTGSSISKASLVISSADVSKTYDGTTSAAGMAVAAAGTQVFAGDNLTGGSFAFADKHVGTGKSVTVSGVTVDDGNNGDNYTVSYADNTSSTINKASLVISTADVIKTYDGTTSAAGTAVASSGTQVFAGDSLTGGSFAFTDKHAGSGKSVTVSAVTVDDGNNGDNYTVSYTDNTNSTINKASLSISVTDASKIYDGTTAASSHAVIVSGNLLGGDTLNGATFHYADKNAGTGKHVITSNAQISDGNNGANYDVTYVDNTNSSISKRLLTISAVADSKEYDGKLSSTGKPVVAGRQRGDSIAGLTQSYLDKNAGTGKAINVDAGYTIRDGNNGNNYDVVLVNSTAGVITPKALTISTVANTKVYDGGVTSANKPSVTGLLSGDRMTGLFQQYESKTVGENKKLIIKSGYVLNDGNGGSNYTVTEQGSMDGVITAH